jgi:hypothetical protein
MKRTIKMSLAAGLLMATAAQAQSPSWSDAQTEAWAVIERSWIDDTQEAGKWLVEYTHENYIGWDDETAAPRDHSASIEWQLLDSRRSERFYYHITPLSIAVEGDTAVVAYYVDQIARGGGAGGHAIRGTVEVLIRDGGAWKFLSTVQFTPKFDN